jgi:glucosylceramidase
MKRSTSGALWEDLTMPKTLWTVLAVGLLAVGAAGCSRGGGGGRDIAGEVCQKAETCNVLSGINAAQCRDVIAGSLQSLPSAERADAEQALDACLTTADCANLNACIDGALTGGSGGSGGSPAGGSSGSSAGGSGGSSAVGSGGNSAVGSGGISVVASGGSSAGGSGGSSAGGRGGSSAGGSGGSGGSSVVGSGGSSVVGSGGSSVIGSGGSSVVGSGGSSVVGSGGAGSGGTTTTSSGGNATGGAATGGSSTSTALELITSAQNAYWNTTGQATQVTSGTADVVIDKNTTYQRWDGFGGTFNEMGWDALSVVSAEIPNALKYLFDATEGANFVYGRLPLGASDYSMSWYTLDDTAGDYTMDKFSIARDKEKLIPFIKEALKVKPDLHLWASPWVLPSWMLSSSNIKTDAQTLKAHALYFARFVEEYAKEGINIEAVHFQNEPGYGRVHGWTGSLFVSYVKTYMGPTFAERSVPAEIWCGTMSKDPDDTNIALATAEDADAMKIVKGFGVQWNPLAAVATLSKKATVMQTEHRCGNYTFDSPYWDKSRYSSSKAQNDHLYGEESWQLIRDWIVAGVNSYSAWNMVLDTVGKSLDGWPQNAPLVVDRTAKKLILTPAYYVFRHFSATIAPGATRIGATGSGDAYKGASNSNWNAVNAFAFKNPDGSIVVQLYNKNAASTKTTVGVGSALSQTLYQFDVPGHGWATLRVPQ